jgi:hypothetical protein
MVICLHIGARVPKRNFSFMRRHGRQKQSERQSTFAPIGFLIAWSVGLSQYPLNDNARLYAILDLSMCAFIIAFVWILPTEFTYIRGLFSVIMFGFGWVWYQNVTGVHIFEMLSQGASKWLEFPLLLRVLYFQLWYYIALAILGAVLLIFAIVIQPLWRRRSSNTFRNADHLFLNQLVNMPTLSTLSEFQTWRSIPKGGCTICFEPVSTENRIELECKHVFHAVCLSEWTDTNINRETTCPSCKQPVLIELS